MLGLYLVLLTYSGRVVYQTCHNHDESDFMIVIDSSLSYPEYADVLTSEAYIKARDAHAVAAASGNTDKEKEARDAYLLACTSAFKELDRTQVDVQAFSAELAKIVEVGRQIDNLGLVGSKFVSKFLEKVLDQSQFQDALLSKQLVDFEPVVLSFLLILDEAFRSTGLEAEEIVSLATNLSAYSAKHGHSSAKVSGDSDLSAVVNGISGALVGANSYTGASGGGLGKAPVLIYAFSYRFNLKGIVYSVYDFLKTEDVTELGVSSNALLAKVNQVLLNAEVGSSAELDSTYKLKFIQVSADHGVTYDKLAIIPSNTQLELIAAIGNSHYHQVMALNDAEKEAEDAGLTDKEKKARKKGNFVTKHYVQFRSIGTVASNPQNVSVLYQKLFSRGVPRFSNIPYIRVTDVGNNKVHVVDSWFEKRGLLTRDQEEIASKLGAVSNLVSMLPNQSKRSVSKGAINSVVYILRQHVNFQLSTLKESKSYVEAHKDELDSELGLIKLILGEKLSEEEATLLAECVVNKVVNCPESSRESLVETLKEYWV